MIRYTCGDCGWRIVADNHDAYADGDIETHEQEHRDLKEDLARTAAVAAVASLRLADIHVLVAALAGGDNELLLRTVNEVRALNGY